VCTSLAAVCTSLAAVCTTWPACADGVHDVACLAAWIDPTNLDRMPIHPSMRIRIVQALTEPDTPHVG